MNAQRWAAALAAVVTVTAVGSGVGTPPVGAAGPDREQRTSHLTSSGMVVETVTRGEASVTTYGTAGAQVRWVEQGTHEALVGVTMPTGDTASAVSRGEVAPTVYEMSLASGMSAAEACAFARDMDGYGCQTSTEVETASRARPTPAPGADRAAANPVYDSWCYDLRSTAGDGTKYNHSCVVRYLDFQTKGHLWLANKMKATGWVEDPGAVYDRLQGVGVQIRYRNENSTAVDWDPFATDTVGSCREEGVSVEGKSGASYSSSTTVCPDRIGPWNSDDFQYFGAKWTSGDEAPADESRGVIAASVHKIGTGVGPGASLYAWLAWS